MHTVVFRKQSIRPLLQTAWKSCFSFFIDFSKAFDSVDYWLLSSKLIDSSDCISCFFATRLPATWYTVGNPCSCVGKMYALAILVVTKVCDEEVYCHLCCLDFIFVI